MEVLDHTTWVVDQIAFQAFLASVEHTDIFVVEHIVVDMGLFALVASKVSTFEALGTHVISNDSVSQPQPNRKVMEWDGGP